MSCLVSTYSVFCIIHYSFRYWTLYRNSNLCISSDWRRLLALTITPEFPLFLLDLFVFFEKALSSEPSISGANLLTLKVFLCTFFLRGIKTSSRACAMQWQQTPWQQDNTTKQHNITKKNHKTYPTGGFDGWSRTGSREAGITGTTGKKDGQIFFDR